MHAVARLIRRVAADESDFRLETGGWKCGAAGPRAALGFLLRAALVFACLAPALSLADTSGASISIVAPTISLPYSTSAQSGDFEVFVQASGSSQPQVGSFDLEVQLPNLTGVTFSVPGNPTPTTHPYIFSPQQLMSSQVGLSNAGQTAFVTDFADTPPTLSNGVGLLLLDYQIAAGATGYFPLTLVPYSSSTNPPGTSLLGSDINSTPIPSTLVSGSISIPTPTAYWSGAIDGNWTTDLFNSNHTGATNWAIDSAGATDTHIAPSATTDVFFTATSGAGNLNTTLGADFSIKGLTFTSTATSPVTIGGANTLTIGADGLTVQSGSAAPTINSAVTLGGGETWNVANAASAPLTIGGTLRTAGGTWTKSGGGTLRVNSPPVLASNTTLNVTAGTLEFNLSSPVLSIGSGVTATIAAGATLELAGTAPALALGTTHVAIQNNATAASGGGLLVVGTGQQIGAVTGVGTLTVGAGASLTVDSIQQSALVIGAGGVLTLDPSNANGDPLSSSGAASSSMIQSNAAPFAAGLMPSATNLSLAPSNDASAASLGATFSTAAVNSVPEPAALLLALVGAVFCLIGTRRI